MLGILEKNGAGDERTPRDFSRGSFVSIVAAFAGMRANQSAAPTSVRPMPRGAPAFLPPTVTSAFACSTQWLLGWAARDGAAPGLLLGKSMNTAGWPVPMLLALVSIMCLASMISG